MLPRAALRISSPLSRTTARARVLPAFARPCSPIFTLGHHPCRRPFSLFSSPFTSPFKSAPTPSPYVVAHITRLEAEANANPHSLEKQLSLFQALIETKLAPSYTLVVERWERMCEFDPASPLLQSSEAFELYLKCLVNSGKKDSVNAAVRRRDALLASHSANVSSSSTSTEGTVPDKATLTSPATSKEISDNATTPQTSSQTVAQSVLNSPLLGSAASPTSRLKLAQDADPSAPLLVSIVEQKASWIPKLVRFVLTLAVASFFFLVILSVFFENSGFMKAGPKLAQYEDAESSRVKFSDLHGVDEAKEELEDVVQFLKDPARFATLGGQLSKGVLLTGPPGTGKTMLARAVAGEAGVPFFFASGSDFEEVFVGVGAKRVRELFAAARKKQPAIIFIDELDAVGGKRGARDSQYMKQTLNQLLVEMDGFQQNEGVIVIAATNFPKSLDPALTRPGRFDRHISIPLPDVRGRVGILKHHMAKVKYQTDVDTMRLARGTPGFSGADLQNMVNQAAVQASKLQAAAVTIKHFEWAKDRIVMGAERKSSYMKPDVKLATAYHEGGHALVALYTEGAMPLHKVTCVPRGHSLGMTSMLPADDVVSSSLKEYKASIAVSMGGRVAEELIYGPENVSSGASSDIQNATHTALRMVKYFGFSSLGPVLYDDSQRKISPERTLEIEDEVAKLVRGGEADAFTLLKGRMDELHRLASALVEHETLDAEEVRKVIKGEPIPTLTEVVANDLSLSSGESATKM